MANARANPGVSQDGSSEAIPIITTAALAIAAVTHCCYSAPWRRTAHSMNCLSALQFDNRQAGQLSNPLA